MSIEYRYPLSLKYLAERLSPDTTEEEQKLLEENLSGSPLLHNKRQDARTLAQRPRILSLCLDV